jgi:hypothetical protein
MPNYFESHIKSSPSLEKSSSSAVPVRFSSKPRAVVLGEGFLKKKVMKPTAPDGKADVRLLVGNRKSPQSFCVMSRYPA